MRFKIFAIMIIIFKVLDAMITMYAVNNGFMYELNPYFGYSFTNQFPVVIIVIIMMWIWLQKVAPVNRLYAKVANWLMLFFVAVFLYPVINNLIVISFF